LRILFIAFRDYANPEAVGGDIYLWELACGLSKLGNKVTFMCSSFEGSKTKDNIEGVDLVRIKGLWNLSFKIMKTYFKEFKGNFDVVIEEAFGGQRLPFFTAFYIKSPLIAVWHQRNTKIFREQYPIPLAILLILLEFFQARIYRNHLIITPSKCAKEKILGLGFTRNKVKVIYDGVGSIFQNPKAHPEREAIIVCLGKLRRYKRFDHPILALPLVLKKYRTCKLVIAGKISEIDKNYAEELRHLSEKLRVENNVDFKFNISEEEKLALLGRASVLVQPSPVEGFSIVVIEANRSGTPVIASDGVPADVVIDGYNGLVYPYGDINGLSNSISKLLIDAELWRQMSENALGWSKKFNWPSSSIALQKILDSIAT
jgi:glycosyltransferase involved in cell wall biosynthesis